VNTRELEKSLVNYIVAHSGHDGKRSYIGLSGIGDCPRAIYLRHVHGEEPPSVAQHLKFKRGYEAEEAIIRYLRGLGLYRAGETIRLYDGLVQGHTDGRIRASSDRIGDSLLEIKSVAVPEHFPEGERVPLRVYWQTTAYMHYLGRRYCHVIYLACSSGEPRLYGVSYRPGLGRQIEDKVNGLVEAVRACQIPACSCGRCGAGGLVGKDGYYE